MTPGHSALLKSLCRSLKQDVWETGKHDDKELAKLFEELLSGQIDAHAHPLQHYVRPTPQKCIDPSLLFCQEFYERFKKSCQAEACRRSIIAVSRKFERSDWLNDTIPPKLVSELREHLHLPFVRANKPTPKSAHIAFHYACLVYYFVTLKILGYTDEEAYFHGSRCARISVLSNELVGKGIEYDIYDGCGDLKVYCDQRNLIYNVLLKSMRDSWNELYSALSSFALLNEKDGSINVINIYNDTGVGTANSIPTKEKSYHDWKKQLELMFRRSTNNTLEELIARESISQAAPDVGKLAALRVVGSDGNLVLVKCTVLTRKQKIVQIEKYRRLALAR